MLLIIGTVRLPPDKLAEARPAMQRMISASRAEPGCIEYSYAQDVLDAGLIHVSEVWSDRAALDAHFRSAHIADWRASWAALGIRDRNLMLYEAGDAKAT
ncbi:antibiotic biosynthesis monooxygenase [Mesorhizobium waimense]|uniref:Antibiotic biosynthesis monooxygenase n=1 Tax=Mesorhizobium waimense TaxID=1300307 RepID=A0A3A5KZD8_9HYPH|nr:putative quinol monooxygenase [Mesorhizobium waimense]RJT39014.1 antibiotic biosynthesis monooxygenase [Mesorhizobium waimense]